MKMKKYISMILAACSVLVMSSCTKDEVSSESIFKEENHRYTEFDSWLQRNYVEPYNVRFEYRMPDRETSFNYWVSPPNIKESIMIAKLIKFTTLEAMVEMMSSGDETEDPALFVKSYFPKVLFLVGSFEISSSGSTALASAENGLQINILGVNFFEYHKDAERIAGTMLHEFTHILDGIHGSPAEFKDITLSDYVGDRYTSLTDDPYQKGFVSNYARSHYSEDVAETGGRLISLTEEEREAMIAKAGPVGGPLMRKKFDMLKKWLKDSYGVDSERWCEIYHRRIAQLDSLDWESLDE
jgi:substrate import-associated zinc metallohydrolase lipoprotein